MTGKIIKGIGGFYYVHDGIDHVYECKAKGIFRNKKIKPLVGDNVSITVLDEDNFIGQIDDILPRQNSLLRPAVANVDQVFIVQAISHPKPNLNLLDRYLVILKQSKVPVTIVFNKIELSEIEEQNQLEKIYIPAGYQVLFISNYENNGIEELKERLAGKTTVLAGPSGVGKSSLINILYPDASMETGQISKKIERGKHTTRHSELFCIEKGTFVMDTPGFSSIFIDEIKPENLKDYFSEFEEFEDDCKFLGCVHIGEKVCGIKDAVSDGRIANSRYENYKLIYQELKDKKLY